MNNTSRNKALMAVAAPRSHEAAALLDYVIYERGLELGAISPKPHTIDAKALYTLIVQAMTSDTGHRNLRPVVPPDLNVALDAQALSHALRTTALHFKTEKPLSVNIIRTGNKLRIQCKSAASKAIENTEGLRANLQQALNMLGAELDLDPLTPSSLTLQITLPKPDARAKTPPKR